jgi:hypothetical protein
VRERLPGEPITLAEEFVLLKHDTYMMSNRQNYCLFYKSIILLQAENGRPTILAHMYSGGSPNH